MPSGDTQYQARFETAEFLEKSRNNDIVCRVYAGGSAISPVTEAGSTVSVYDASGTAIVDGAAVTVSNGVATYTVLSTALADSSYERGWRVEWSLVMDDTNTHVFRNEAYLCLRVHHCPITEADLLRRHQDLGNLRESTRSDFSDEIAEVWAECQNRIVKLGRRPQLIMSPADLRKYLMESALSLIYENFAHGSGEERYLEMADRHRAMAENEWPPPYSYDADEDGNADDAGATRQAKPPCFLSSPKAGSVR